MKTIIRTNAKASPNNKCWTAMRYYSVGFEYDISYSWSENEDSSDTRMKHFSWGMAWANGLQFSKQYRI